jgi:hypothetical protein
VTLDQIAPPRIEAFDELRRRALRAVERLRQAEHAAARTEAAVALVRAQAEEQALARAADIVREAEQRARFVTEQANLVISDAEQQVARTERQLARLRHEIDEARTHLVSLQAAQQPPEARRAAEATDSTTTETGPHR